MTDGTDLAIMIYCLQLNRIYAAPRCGYARRFFIFFLLFVFSLYERKTNNDEIGSTGAITAGKAVFESATA
jgi:hypothetical protein